MGALVGCALLGASCRSPSAPPPRTAALVGEQEELFAVDWPTSMRVDLETNARRGIVVVAYREGTSVRVLPGCTADGSYRSESVSPKADIVRFATREQLSAKLPFSGLALANTVGVDGTSERVVDLAIVTRTRASAPLLPVGRPELRGDCEGATHVVTSFQRGAFTLAARSSTDIAASADVLGLGARGASGASSIVSKSDGDPGACRQESASACDALLTIAVRPLARSSKLSDPAGASGWWRASCKSKDECLTACEAGDMDGCAAASLYLLEEGDYRRAERYGRASCDADKGHGCTVLGMVYDPIKQTPGALHDAEKASSLYARACDLGSLTGCVLLAYYAQKKEPFRPDEESRIKLVGKGCSGGNASCCNVAAGWYQAKASWLARTTTRGVKSSFDEALRFEDLYCKVATAKELAKTPCSLANWRNVRRDLERFPD